MTKLIADRLRGRLRTAGPDPLLTYYDIHTEERTELSTVTVANWVAKTCNLLVDEYLLDAGDVVELGVATEAPGHWVTACWELACWQLGLTVSVASGRPPRLVVTGPSAASPLVGGADVVACSLHPLGLGFAEPLPAGVADYALEVRGQPDVYTAVPQSGLATAWVDAERQVSQADLVSGVDATPLRRLVRPSTPWFTALAGVVTALVSGGSAVVVVGDDEDRIQHIAAEERVDATLP